MDILDRCALTFKGRRLPEHTFLLGNRGGFVLYLPASRNMRDRTLQSIKWFGASGFGRSFLEGIQVWVELDGDLVALDRRNQTELIMSLDGATRSYRLGRREVRESFFVPDHLQVVVWRLNADLPCVLKPEFDLRYYQAFNTDFSQYWAEDTSQGLMVGNTVRSVGPLRETMQFYALVGTIEEVTEIELLPEDQRLVEKTYLKDEERHKLIIDVYKETQVLGPDEAPIWDLYSTKVYAPARLRVHGPVSLLCAFGDTREEVEDAVAELRKDLPRARRRKRARLVRQLQVGLLETGNQNVDMAYAHVLSRFNDALVARDATLHVEPIHHEEYDAIFAGDKYFLDAWKRDENISLGALLLTNDFETVRLVLEDTWQFQDERTGRLPHIIRAGEPLVYYSSDGTLWALQRLFEYTRVSGDETLLHEKMPMVERFFEASLDFAGHGLLPSGGIIDQQYLWETWEDTPYTPRAGYPVEIELLWLSVLSAFLPSVRAQNDELGGRMEQALEEGSQTFEDFVGDGYLVDSLTYDWEQDQILTPNGYIAFGLGYPLPPDLGHSMVLLGRDQLAGHRGVRSLAPRDWRKVLPAAFLADPHNVQGKDMASVGIFNYHRGIEWEWLNPFFVAAELTCGSTKEAYRRYVAGQVIEAIDEVGIGGLSELHDMRGQVGADFQAWSMAGFITSLQLFAGVQVDALAKTVRIRPSLPPEWPYLRCRRRVGNTRFDVRYEQPRPTAYRLQVHPLGEPPAGYQLHLGLRLPPRSRVETATCNGRAVPSDAWSYEDGCAPDIAGAAWTVQPFEKDVILQVEVSER